MKPSVQTKSTPKQKKYIILGLGVAALGVGGYFVYKHIKDKQDENDLKAFMDDVNNPSTSTSSSSSSNGNSSKKTVNIPKGYKPKPANSTLPLKRGSKGVLVKDVQNALMNKFGGSILPKYGADGYYGKEMESALISKGINTAIDSDLYGKLVAGNLDAGNKKQQPSNKTQTGKATEKLNGTTVKSISKQLHTAIEKDDIFKALSALKRIQNKNWYNAVNEEFKKTRVMLVSMTIVTALNRQFYSSEYKKKLNAEFYRIGLKFDGEKWSLSGFAQQVLVTNRTADIWDSNGNSMKIPSMTILGEYDSESQGIARFQTLDRRWLYVRTSDVNFSYDQGN